MFSDGIERAPVWLLLAAFVSSLKFGFGVLLLFVMCFESLATTLGVQVRNENWATFGLLLAIVCAP